MAIAHGNDTAAQTASTGTTYTVAHNLSAGVNNNRLLIVVGSQDQSGPPTLTCTYNGVSMNALTMQISNSVQNRLFYLLDADLPTSSGNYNIILSTTISGYLKIIASDFTGVFQGAQDSQAGNAVGVADYITLDIETFAEDSLVYVGAGNSSSSATWTTHEANYTIAGELEGGNAFAACATWRVEPTAGWKSPTDTSNTGWYLSSVGAAWSPADEALNISFTPETLAASESLSVKRGGNLVSASESLSLADSISKMTIGQVKGSLVFTLDLAEGLIVEPGTVILTPDADTAGLAESISFQSAKTVQVYDGLVMTDSLSELIPGGLKMYFTDTLDVADQPLTTEYNPSTHVVSDALVIAEELLFEYLIIAVQVSDGVDFSEQASKYFPPLTMSVMDALAVVDAVVPAWNPINIVMDEDLLFADMFSVNYSRGLNTLFHFTALTGGAAGALDSIDGGSLIDGDLAYTILPGTSQMYVHYLDDDYGGAESSPTTITPDTNAGVKRWRKCTFG